MELARIVRSTRRALAKFLRRRLPLAGGPCWHRARRQGLRRGGKGRFVADAAPLFQTPAPWGPFRMPRHQLTPAELRAVAVRARAASMKRTFFDPADREQCIAFAEAFERLAEARELAAAIRAARSIRP